MEKSKKDLNLLDTNPELVKEWHPTANVDLTPRNIQIGYPEKVWWLCSVGHKWQDTIECRLEGKDCPICENESIKPNFDFSIDLPSMGTNYRKNRRFKTKTTAVIEIPDSGHWIYAQMTDFNRHGLCFETDAAIEPGTVISIRFDKPIVSSRLDESFKSLFANGYGITNSTVKWCKQLDDDQSISNFSIGVEIS